MRKAVKILGIVVVMLSCVSCQQNLNRSDYSNYVSDKENDLKKVSSIDGWEFCIQYRPYDYIALMENKGMGTEHDLDKRKSELAGTAWFNISIKRADNSNSPLRYGISSLEGYNERLNYYLNEAANDIRLTYGKDTLSPMSYLFENNYNLTPQETIVVGFSLPEGELRPCKNMRISMVDRVFRNGIINAEFSVETLEKIPALVY